MDKVVLNLLAELLFMRITLDVQMGGFRGPNRHQPRYVSGRVFEETGH